jgi:formate C-acetyltransferase
VLDKDGKKMSKSSKNYTDPMTLMKTVGTDAYRIYLFRSNAMNMNDFAFDDAGLSEQLTAVILPLFSAVSFFTTYAHIDGFEPAKITEPKSDNILDKFILARLYEMETFDAVKEAYEKQVNYYVDWQVTMTNFYELVAAEIMPIPIASATIDGCMENGLDVTWGGAKYNSTGTSGIGCANVADSLSAIKHLVYDTKKYTAREYYDAVMAKWEGYEPMRQEVLNAAPSYGNNDPYVDELARWSMNVFAERVAKGTGFRGKYRAGIYPVSAHIAFGGNTFATPDGRFSHEPLADGVSPKQGLDKNGPVSTMNSVACLDHGKFANGTLLNMKFHPKSVEGDGGLQKLRHLVQTFFEKGGMHLQYNVVSSDTLREAQKNPEDHKDLVIRIAGFSAYFVELYPELQNDLIRRTDIGL